jgi:hypothetical protein
MGTGQHTKEMPFESLYGAFSGVGAFSVWGHQVIGYCLGNEELE